MSLLKNNYDLLETVIENKLRLIAYEYAQDIINSIFNTGFIVDDHKMWLESLTDNSLIGTRTDKLWAVARIYQELLDKELPYKEILKCFYFLKYTEIKELEKAELPILDSMYAHKNNLWPQWSRDILRHWLCQEIAIALQTDPIIAAHSLSIKILDDFYKLIESRGDERSYNLIGEILFTSDFREKMKNNYNRIWQYKPLRDKEEKEDQ